MRLFCFILFLSLFISYGCYDKKADIPAHFPTPVKEINYSAEAELGKMLFYEPALSRNGKLSCASCHNPSHAFADSLSFSTGVNRQKTFRNAPSLMNLAWRKDFFWDGGVFDLESQVISSVTTTNEMGESFANIISKLNKKPEYRNKFEEVYGSDSITGLRIIYAIAEFERTLISANSPYDSYVKGEKQLTDLQLKGMRVFEQKCSPCHAGVLFTDNQFHNTGLDSSYPSARRMDEPELGRARITNNYADRGKYRTPSLRNVMLTAPYMHDGRFTNISEVLNHYSAHIYNSPLTDSLLVNGNGKSQINLSKADKEALIIFLHTLTDSSLIVKHNN